jgi:hypothetical protein
MNKKSYFSNYTAITYLLLLCFACNWMLLLNDGFFWDDNVYYGLIQGQHYEEFTTFILETGLPINILFFRGMDYLIGITNHRWVSFATIFFSAILLNDLFKHIAGKYKSLSLVFATLYLTLFPFKSTVLLCTTVYQVMLLLFIAAVYVRVRFGINESKWVRVTSRVTFIMLSFISFNTASILVAFYFYLAFEYFCLYEPSQSAWSRKKILDYIKNNIFEILLPIIYWLIKENFFPTHGLYVNYNKINFDLQNTISVTSKFLSRIFKYNPLYSVTTKSQLLALLIFLFPLLLMSFSWTSAWKRFNLSPFRGNQWLWLFWPTSFLIITALPYALLQIVGSPQGWESRHYILLTLSLPIFILAVVGLYLNRIREIAQLSSIGFLFRPLICTIALAGAVNMNIVYLDYQALAIKQWSVVENLKVKPELKKFSSFWINDQVGDFSKKGFTWYEATHQSWYEWVAIFTKAWGAEKWFGNNSDEPSASSYKGTRYSASEINPTGMECRLTLLKTTPLSKYDIVRHYWSAKYFGTDDQRKAFLLSISSISSCLD